MKIEKRSDGFWITGVEPYTVDGETFAEWGPYDTRDAAVEDLPKSERAKYRKRSRSRKAAAKKRRVSKGTRR